jgi:methylphosphotriester-DNA--protein-cysteine methyltransferase
MITHIGLGSFAFARSRQLKKLVLIEAVSLAGNKQLRIYGTLQCRSGKRMQVHNRVFFRDEAEAIYFQYRPCGHCMQEAYLVWKAKQSQERDRHR